MITERLQKISPKSAYSYFDQRLKYEIGPMELKEKLDNKHTDYYLIDVRSREAYKEGHIPGAKSVPFEEFNTLTWEFSEDRDNIVYCYTLTCQLAASAAKWLAERGYPVKMLVGGFDEWKKCGNPVDK